MTEQQIFDWYRTAGLTAAGAAGMTANICIESAYNPKNLQNSYEKKLGYTDESYTAAVDSGNYKDFGADRAGYGFCQWTSGGRKAGLLKYAKSKGVSVGDPIAQLEYSLKEMSTDLSATLRRISDPFEAARLVMVKFERPANQSEANQMARGDKGKEIYTRCTKTQQRAPESASEGIMDIITHTLMSNDCFKKGAKLSPDGILVHSTGVNNRNVTRYVDARGLGPVGSNHWNKSGINKCVHFMIGWAANYGRIVTVSTLPLNMKPWGCGSGSKGSYNNSHIQFEICEGGDDKTYAKAAYTEAVNLCAYLCKKYGWTEAKIISHAEAHAKGYASNHGDADSYFKLIGKTMKDFRADVKKKLSGASESASKGTSTKKTTANTLQNAEKKDDALRGSYKVNDPTGAELRFGPGAGSYETQGNVKKGAAVKCYGYYSPDDKGRKWLYVLTEDGRQGFILQSLLTLTKV